MTHSNPHADPVPASIPFMAELPIDGSMLAAVMRASEGLTKFWLAWHEELARFTATRFDSDNEIVGKLMMCRDWSQVATIQQEWVAISAKQILDEAGCLIRLGWRVGNGFIPLAGSSGEAAAEEREPHRTTPTEEPS